MAEGKKGKGLGRLIWTPVWDHLDEFTEWWKEKNPKTSAESIGLLVEAHKRGWVEILGSTEKSTEDLAACLQEFYSVKIINTDNPDDLDDLDDFSEEEDVRRN